MKKGVGEVLLKNSDGWRIVAHVSIDYKMSIICRNNKRSYEYLLDPIWYSTYTVCFEKLCFILFATLDKAPFYINGCFRCIPSCWIGSRLFVVKLFHASNYVDRHLFVLSLKQQSKQMINWEKL